MAVVSYRFWVTQLGGDPGVAGSTVGLNGHSFTIVGVTGKAFGGLNPADGAPDVWVPIMMQPVLLPTEGDMLHRVPHETEVWLQGIGRLDPRVSPEAARDDLSGLWKRLEEEFAGWSRGTGVTVTERFSLNPSARQQLGSMLRLLFAAAAAVLLIACANLALLLLSRGAARRKEVGVRLALGAGRWHVARRLLVESLALAVAGGLVGWILAVWLADAAAGLLPLSLHGSLRPDWVVLGFTAALAVVTALASGLAPALMVSRTSIVEEIKTGSPGSGRSVLRSGLVAAQVGLSLAVVAGAGLFVRSLRQAQHVQLGFETGNRLLLTVSLRDYGYSEERGIDFVRLALERLQSIPGVRSVSTTRMVPLGGGMWTSDFEVEGETLLSGTQGPEAPTNAVGPGYFRTLGIPLVAGREFTAQDDRRAAPVVIVNQVLARRIWGDANPIGRIIKRDQYRFTVIGVARSAKYYELGEEPLPQLYYSELQLYQPRVTMVVETATSAAALASVVRREMHALDPSMAIMSLRTFDDVLRASTASYRVTATLVSAFGSLALVLAAVGLYGVLSYLVVNSTREIAVRIALGSGTRQVALRVIRRGVGLAAIGIASGLLLVWPATRLARRFLFGVGVADPLAMGGAVLVLLAVAVAASGVPAQRAARVDPMQALRYE